VSCCLRLYDGYRAKRTVERFFTHGSLDILWTMDILGDTASIFTSDGLTMIVATQANHQMETKQIRWSKLLIVLHAYEEASNSRVTDDEEYPCPSHLHRKGVHINPNQKSKSKSPATALTHENCPFLLTQRFPNPTISCMWNWRLCKILQVRSEVKGRGDGWFGASCLDSDSGLAPMSSLGVVSTIMPSAMLYCPFSHSQGER
jgi:hypothetical protein